MVTGYYSCVLDGRLTIRGLKSYLLCFTKGVELLIMETSVALYQPGWSGSRVSWDQMGGFWRGPKGGRWLQNGGNGAVVAKRH